VASELFGHRRGAFTGAHEDRQGAFVKANGGTLFLDEVGELPLEVQPMLLRALELGEVRPVGDDRPSRVKVRVVAATNRDLEGEVTAGRFRQDLFYRLAVVRLPVPPLRERVEDIPALAQRFGAAVGLGEIRPELLQALRARSWPGNVRELRNVIQAYAALGTLPRSARSSEGGLEEELAQLVEVAKPYADQKDALVERFTKIYLQALLQHTHGNQSVAADISGLSRSYLGKLLARHGLDGRTFRRGT
jgi:DNA-binding NtrC family response regulator